MAKPIVGVVANSQMINNQYPAQATGAMSLEAVAEVCGAMPLIIPSMPDAVDLHVILQMCDGFLLTGGRPNVHPDEYGHVATEAHGTFDRGRDGIALPMIRACVERGQPILGVCRGFQEFNVAFGGTLHPEIRELPGRMNHRMPPDGTLEEKFALRHPIKLTADGVFARLFGSDEVLVNSLHGQGIEDAGGRIVVEGWAPDGTPEAISIKDAPGFALAVQWHPEYKAGEDPVSKPLFEAFGRALRAWRHGEALAAE
ncbi:MAG: gamma-glutamyl-gamma-aminobutyrate hydrolase family protein [Rhodospirillaceae bacterium]